MPEVRRREFITMLGGAAMPRGRPARAQQPGKIGIELRLWQTVFASRQAGLLSHRAFA